MPFGMLKNLFKEAGVKDVITIFHSPKSPVSVRAHTLLKQTAATAQTTATEDQASAHDTHSKTQRAEFTLDVQEGEPTSDQLVNIIDYIGQENVGTVVEGATNQTEALRKLKENGNLFKRPVIVDWSNGKAVAGDNESEILNLLKAIRKE